VAKSAQGTAVVTAEIGDHVRSYRHAETAPNGRIRVAVEEFKKERFTGSVAAAARKLNDRLLTGKQKEYSAQINQFHGGIGGHLNQPGSYNPHNTRHNPELLKPVSASQVERLIKSIP
jgi:hypothetical protein